MPADAGGGAGRQRVRPVPERNGLGGESRGVSLVAGALPRTAASALAVGVAERLAHHPARERQRADRIRDSGHGAHAHRRQLGSERSAQDRGAPGGDLSRPDAGDRGAARGAQVRRLQPHVGVRRPRSEEHRRAAVADAEERRAPSRQSGVPEGHADDGRAFGRAHEAADDAVARRNDAGGRAARRRSRRGHRAHPARQGEPAAGPRDAARGEGRRAGPRRPARARDRASRAERDRRDGQGRARVDQAREGRTGWRWSRSATPGAA